MKEKESIEEKINNEIPEPSSSIALNYLYLFIKYIYRFTT